MRNISIGNMGGSMTVSRFNFRAWDGMFMEYNCYPCGDGAVCSRDQETITEARRKPGGVKDSDDVCMIWANKPILMQSTGLTDRNGKEIYEGDIVETSEGINHVVKWNDHGYLIDGTANEWAYGFALPDYEDTMQIVGNIYQNADMVGAQ